VSFWCSRSVVENATATVCEQDIDYYPYGGVQKDYCSGTGVPQNYKFTGKERDAESGLDNFGARYDSSSLGRFMTLTCCPLFHTLGNPTKFFSAILDLSGWSESTPRVSIYSQSNGSGGLGTCYHGDGMGRSAPCTASTSSTSVSTAPATAGA
jgi:RHS repeat-associated protein